LRAERGLRVDLVVETHDVLIDSERVLAFVNAQPHGSVSVLWDAHHTWKKGGEDPLVTWRAIHPHVTHVHVKDSRSIPQGKYAYTYVAPGTGEFPMNTLRTVLAAEYRGAVSLEWEKWWHPYLSPLDGALASATQHNWW
jgi:sugar phosphate isomerase/epimerase